MDISLDELIKKSKLDKKQKPGQSKSQQKRPTAIARGRVSDVREKINKRRNMQLRNQDARQRLMAMKRQKITDARQMLRRKSAPLSTSMPAPKSKPVDFVVPKKVIKNNLYRTPPPPRVTVEYESPSPRPANRIPVQVTQRLQQARPIAASRQYEQQARPIAVTRHYEQQARPIGVSRQFEQPQSQPSRFRESPVYRERSRSPPRRSSAHTEPKVVQGYKVAINNLHPGVTREDIYELFSSVGDVKKCVLLRPGDAEVVYPKKEDANAAVRRYHRRELDGMPMKLSISTVGIKMSGNSGSVPVNEQAVRAALFRSDSGRHDRPVNFHVAV